MMHVWGIGNFLDLVCFMKLVLEICDSDGIGICLIREELIPYDLGKPNEIGEFQQLRDNCKNYAATSLCCKNSIVKFDNPSPFLSVFPMILNSC